MHVLGPHRADRQPGGQLHRHRGQIRTGERVEHRRHRMAAVAGEHLVAALTGQQHLEAVVARLAGDEPGQLVRRVGEQIATRWQQLGLGRLAWEVGHVSTEGSLSSATAAASSSRPSPRSSAGQRMQ